MDETEVEENYLAMREDYMGWCTNCKDITRDSTEPDAEGYDCPECEENTVQGADIFLMENA